MAQRIVFGRRQVDFEGKLFTIEMRVDGIFVRRKHCREEWKLSFDRLLNHAQRQPELIWDDKRQPEMFNPLDSGDQKEPMSSLPEGQLVRHDSGREGSPVHASGEPATKVAEERGDGVDTPYESAPGSFGGSAARAAIDPCGDKLPENAGGVGGGNQGGTAEGTVSLPRGEPVEPPVDGGNVGTTTPGVGVSDEGRV